MSKNVEDKVGKEYWSKVWWERKRDIPSAMNWEDCSLNNYRNYKLNKYFESVFSGLDTSNMDLLEVGCAGSDKLPYFGRKFGFNICGLDYSEKGCELSRKILEKENVEGNILCEDMFDPPDKLMGKFDVVISFGVIEHFEDTKNAINALHKMAKKSGLVISVIPNMNFLVGSLQRIVDNKVYRMHKPISVDSLISSHDSEKFETLECRYFMSLNLNIVNTSRYKEGIKRKVIDRLKSYITKVFWVSKMDYIIPPNKFTSPNIISVAKVK